MREHWKLVVTSGSPLGVTKFYKVVMNHLNKLEIKLPYDPAVPLLGIYLEEIELKKTHAAQCSLQHYLQQLEHGSNLDVHQQMNGYRCCGTYIQWNTARP